MTTKTVDDPFWVQDPKILIDQNKLVEFWPTSNRSRNENLNAISRFGIYTGIVLSLYHKKWKFLYITVLFLFLTQLLWSQESFDTADYATNPVNTLDQDPEAVKPSIDNPLMNPNFTDLANNPNKKPEEYYDNSDASIAIRKDITDKFNFNLYTDANDFYGKSHSERQFYTVPSTDRDAFQNWLYKGAASCKDNYKKCLKYEDLRNKAPPMFKPIQEPM